MFTLSAAASSSVAIEARANVWQEKVWSVTSLGGGWHLQTHRSSLSAYSLPSKVSDIRGPMHSMTPCAPHAGQSTGSPSRARGDPLIVRKPLDARTMPPEVDLAPALM